MRVTVLALALIGMTACGSASGAIKGPQSAPGDAAAWWGPLFVEGTTMKFAVVAKHDDIDPDTADSEQPKWTKNTEKLDIACKVDGVVTHGVYKGAVVSCGDYDPALVYPSLMGLWVTDGNKLWHLGDVALDQAEARIDNGVKEDATLTLPMTATKRVTEEAETIVASPDGTMWCATQNILVGDGGYDEVCLAPGRGIVRVRVGGGSAWNTVDTTYTLR